MNFDHKVLKIYLKFINSQVIPDRKVEKNRENSKKENRHNGKDQIEYQIPNVMYSEKDKFKCVSSANTEEFALLMRKKNAWEKFFTIEDRETAMSSENFIIHSVSTENLEDLKLICSRFESLNTNTAKDPLQLTLQEIYLYYIEEHFGNTYIMEIGAVSPIWALKWTFGNYTHEQDLDSHLVLAATWDWLSSLPYHKFWSQIVYDESTQMALLAYLYRHKLFKYYYEPDHFYHTIDNNIECTIKLIFQRLFLETHFDESELLYEKNCELLQLTPFCTVSAIVPLCELFTITSQWNTIVSKARHFGTDDKVVELLKLCVQFIYHLDKAEAYTDLLAKDCDEGDDPIIILCILLSYIETSFALRKIVLVHQSLITVLRYLDLPLKLAKFFLCPVFDAKFLVKHFFNRVSPIKFASIWSTVKNIQKEIVFFIRLIMEHIFVAISDEKVPAVKKANRRELYKIYVVLAGNPKLRNCFFEFFSVHKDIKRLSDRFEKFTPQEQALMQNLIFKNICYDNEMRIKQRSSLDPNDFNNFARDPTSFLDSYDTYYNDQQFDTDHLDCHIKAYSYTFDSEEGKNLIKFLTNSNLNVTEFPLTHISDYISTMIDIVKEECNVAKEEMENEPPPLEVCFSGLTNEHFNNTFMKYGAVLKYLECDLEEESSPDSTLDSDTYEKQLKNDKLRTIKVKPSLAEEEKTKAWEKKKAEAEKMVLAYKLKFKEALLKDLFLNNYAYFKKLKCQELNTYGSEGLITKPESIFAKNSPSYHVFLTIKAAIENYPLDTVSVEEITEVYLYLYRPGWLTKKTAFDFTVYCNMIAMIQLLKKLNNPTSEFIISANEDNENYEFILKRRRKNKTLKRQSVLKKPMSLENQSQQNAILPKPESTTKIKFSEPLRKTEKYHQDLQPIGSDDTLTHQAIFESLIEEIKLIFPDYGEGFIEKCLKHYSMNTQQVINAILENTLPDHLSSMDRSMPIIPPEIPEEIKTEKELKPLSTDPQELKSILKRRPDDVQEFRKKNQFNSPSLRSFLNDKSHINKKEYEKYQCFTYEDDFEDNDLSPTRVLKTAALDTKDDYASDFRSGASNLNIIKNKKKVEQIEEEESEDNEEEETNKQDRYKNFCQDPALLRQKAEERRQLKKPPSLRNVVGNPKGQGQEKNVLRNRSNKNTHKATAANHNRRSGARFKRNQGMFSS